ncbi:MAG TPA: hypothetical protein VGM90_36870 [Kofleriaceae bacterium]|jgi:hypothetical protein
MTNTTRLMFTAALVIAGCKGKTADQAAKPATVEAAKPTETTPKAEPAKTEPKELKPGSALTLGGTTLTFSSTETNKGGDNQAPTMKSSVAGKCAGKDIIVLEREDEGGDSTASVNADDKTVTVTLNTHIAREGETSDEQDVATLDLATCQVTKK